MHVFRLKTRLHRQRLGISLLEVIISIGVASVGLLGVLALIPLGGAQARQGQVYERAANIGVAAMGEVRARDMLNPGKLVGYDPINNVVISSGHILYRGGYKAFCVDPLMMSTDNTRAVFPYSAPANATMPRFTLNNGSGAGIDAPLANLIFRSQDDLSLEISNSDRSKPPTQVWSRDGASAATRRQTEGTMSWMLTAFPNLGKGISNSYDLWTVSIVVFNRRIVNPDLTGEFVATVTSMPGGGVAGGDIEIEFSGYATAEALQEALTEAKTPENSWVLMSGIAPTGTTPATVEVFQWYRVLASDDIGNNRRVLTLAGPDWPATITDERITIIPTTVAVFQENMRLELGSGTSLWRY